MKPEEYINKSVKATKLTIAFYSQVGVVKNVKPINHPTLGDVTMLAQPVEVISGLMGRIGKKGLIVATEGQHFVVELDNHQPLRVALSPQDLKLTRTFGGPGKVEFVEGKRPEPSVVHSALDVQPGGSHYKDMKIQPVEFIHANNIPYFEGNVIKYVCRHRNKNGLQDLEKAKHYIELLIELEYGKG